MLNRLLGIVVATICAAGLVWGVSLAANNTSIVNGSNGQQCVFSIDTSGSLTGCTGNTVWLYAPEDTKGNPIINKATFRAVGTVAVSAMATSLTDLVTLTGSATKTLRVTNVTLCGINATTATTTVVSLIKRSTADTGGTTGTAPTATALQGETVSGTLALYTANPTLGTGVGSGIDQFGLNWGAAGSGGCVAVDYGTRNTEAVVLSGVAQQFALNFGGVTQPSGASLTYRLEWTEE